MYKAICVKLSNIRKHPNADRLQLATVCGEQVIVGLDNNEGDLGIYFATDGQLSQEFAVANDLIARVDENGKKAGGFFSEKRHVRAQNFRGEKSYGIWLPMECLAFTGHKEPREGQEFDTWNGVPICTKYVSPATLKTIQSNGMSRKENSHFPKHVETLHMARSSHLFHVNSLVTVTEKLHGTSQRIGYVEEDAPRTWWDWLLGRTRKHYVHLVGTRNTVLKDHEAAGYYGNEEFRFRAVESILPNLHKDEVIYGEVVGYTTTGKSIMAAHDTKDLPEVAKRFGKEIVYHYGCEFGQCKFYVYRILQNGIELSWYQVKQRCSTLGIDSVPEVGSFLVKHAGDIPEQYAYLGEMSCLADHPQEGVVFRIDNQQGTVWVKEKSYEFGVLEGYLKANDVPDMEEAS
jgi:RNA ligase (TIGR02306 family)